MLHHKLLTWIALRNFSVLQQMTMELIFLSLNPGMKIVMQHDTTCVRCGI